MREFKTKNGTSLQISDIKGKEYLQVNQRLVWFREEHADWAIETSFEFHDASEAIARAVIKDATGRIIATSHKHENKQGFADFREKAETGAIGRALALCGYGTQFAPEFDEGDRVADAPLETVPAATDEVPECCGREMMVSKYSKSDADYWYCPNCKQKAGR